MNFIFQLIFYLQETRICLHEFSSQLELGLAKGWTEGSYKAVIKSYLVPKVSFYSALKIKIA